MENLPINELLDLLIEENVKNSNPTVPYYKLYATKEAGRQLSAFETMCVIEELVSIDGIAGLKFDFTQEYNDEGGTYLSVSGEVSYKKEIEGKELSESINFYSGGWDELDDMFDEEIMEHFTADETENLRDALSAMSDHMGGFSDEDVEGAYKFYDATFTKENIHALYRESFPEASSCIEKYLIEKGMGNKTGGTKTPYKMSSRKASDALNKNGPVGPFFCVLS